MEANQLGTLSVQHPPRNSNRERLYRLTNFARLLVLLRIVSFGRGARNIGRETSAAKHRTHEGIVKLSPVIMYRTRRGG